MRDGCRVVDAGYLAPDIPALTPPPFEVGEGAQVIAVNDLVRVARAPRRWVVVGSGKTATDAVTWLLGKGVDPDATCWVRPRDPWMQDRAVVQPDPAVFQGMVADVMDAGAAATSLDDLFLRLEDAGVMLRVDRSVTPTMAKAPTLARWELDLLRSVTDVVRLGHVRRAERDHLVLDQGVVRTGTDTVVVHCAASGLRHPPPVPVWRPEAITLQAIRAGAPCFGAALVGYVEATRDDPEAKNRLCPPTPYGNSLADWVRMTVLGARAVAAYSSEPDIAQWASSVAINPARLPPEHARSPALDAAMERVQRAAPVALPRMAELTA